MERSKNNLHDVFTVQSNTIILLVGVQGMSADRTENTLHDDFTAQFTTVSTSPEEDIHH